MKTIGVTKRNRKVTMSYDKLNAWLRANAMYATSECHYTDGTKPCRCLDVVDDELPVPERRDGLDLAMVRPLNSFEN